MLSDDAYGDADGYDGDDDAWLFLQNLVRLAHDEKSET